MEDLTVLFQQEDQSKIITELKSERGTELPDTSVYKNLDPKEHDVNDKVKRKDKMVMIDAEKNNESAINVTGSSAASNMRPEPVARIALALQKLIVKRAVSFQFGNPVSLNAEISKNEAGIEDAKQALVLKALKRALYDVKEKSFNRKVARSIFSTTEVAEYWYPAESKNNTYGFPSKFKLRCALFSPLKGDELYPYFDETGDMVAFSRQFSITRNSVTKTYFETYTDSAHYQWIQGANGYELIDGYPKPITIGKIPIVFGKQDDVEWADVQNLIDRLEKLLSNFADTNDYHASPKIVIKGNLVGFAKKGDAGSILQLDGDNASASYLAWQNAPESVKLEIETLLKMIYTISQTPDISFDTVKGLGALSGVALKLLFMDAHLKVADHNEVFDEYLQRRINIIKAYIGKFNTQLTTAADELQVEPEVIPYMIGDDKADIEKWLLANGNKPLVSQKTSAQKAGLSNDPDADFEQMQQEASIESTFSLAEPTIA